MRRILVADDEANMRWVLERALTKAGYEVETVEDGQLALDRALAERPDLVLLDLKMPKMDGYQATNVLLERGFSAPIIALTAHAMEEERERTKTFGFSGHLTKPLNFSELLRTISSYA